MANKEHLKKVISALGKISDLLNQKNIPWLLGASGSSMVQGVNIIPYDLDILVSKEDVVRIEKLFDKYLKNSVHNYTDETGTYIECQLEIDGIEIEILELNDLGNPQPINFQGHTVYVNSLENELEEYKKKPNKQNVAKLVERAINQKAS